VLLVLGVVGFGGIITWTELNWRADALRRTLRHAQAVAPAIWNLDPQLATDYLQLAATADGFERLTITAGKGELFYEVQGPLLVGWDRVAEGVGLLPRYRLAVPVTHETQVIGSVEAVAISRTIYTEVLALLGMLVGLILIERSLRVVEGKRTLEQRVKERTEQLVQRGAELRQVVRLLDLSPNIIFVRESPGTFAYFNQGAAGISDGAKVEPNLEKLYQAVLTADAQGNLTRSGVWGGEVEVELRKGAPLHLYVNVALAPAEEASLQRILFIGTDISERRELEARLLRAQRTQALGTLAGGVAHDFNNLLTPILLSVQLLQLKAQADPSAARSYATIEQCARRGADLVRQLLNMAGSRRAECTLVQLPVLLADLQTLMESTFPKRIELAFEWSEALPDIKADSTNLHQTILNLCVNARDAMPAGGQLRLAAAVKEGRLQVPVSGAASTTLTRWIVIEVADTGMGMSKSLQDKIFDPFFSTKDPSEGTGLGLSTAQGIVQSLGGLIEVESEVGVGSTFRLLLPIASETTSSAQSPSVPPAPRSAAGELILVVDDEESILRATKLLLLSTGYRVITAQSGEEALDLLRSSAEPVRVLLTDLMMPQMDGLQLTAAVRQVWPTLPVVMFTGLLNQENRARIAAAGIKKVLPKPFGLKELRRAIGEALKELI
jgi:two-component system, cell cycle sensor histidine kinase and response regulator CckA